MTPPTFQDLKPPAGFPFAAVVSLCLIGGALISLTAAVLDMLAW